MAAGHEVDDSVHAFNFRALVELAAEQLLEQAGFHGSPKAVLIGFPGDGNGELWIATGSDSFSFDAADLDDVSARAEIQYQQREKKYIGADHVRAWLDRLDREWAEAAALKEVLEARTGSEGRTIFVSRAARVAGAGIHVVLSVDSAALDQVPTLGPPSQPQPFLVRSIIEAIIVELLEQAQRELYLPGAGRLEAGQLGRLLFGAPEVRVSAIQLMLRTALIRAGHQFGMQELRQVIEGFTSLFYEGRPSAGRLLIAPRNHWAVTEALIFQAPILLTDKKYVRKLLEASGQDYALLIDGQHVRSLATMTKDPGLANEEIFNITISKRGSWQLEHADKALFTVRDDLPSLPTPTIDQERLRKTFSQLPEADVEGLVALAVAAGRNRHGAMLIISTAAAVEAKRLAPQATLTEPLPLTPELLDQLTNMDGGVLVDPQGRCHAIGVILDGTAQENDDPARGSRHNNAIRYINSGTPHAIVLCYSADGDITVLPEPS